MWLSKTANTFIPSACLLSGLESREYGSRDPSRWPRGTLYPQKLALTWPASSGRSVGIVRSLTQATEFSFVFFFSVYLLLELS
jgi:hypothetical protein